MNKPLVVPRNPNTDAGKLAASPLGQRLSTDQCATLACLLEVTAPKPGNVHRSADFADLTFVDFAASAVAIGPLMETAARSSLGTTVLSAIQATRRVVSTNTNLGTVLLLAPLAAVPRGKEIRTGVRQVLEALNGADAEQVYTAIRLAEPGGLGAATCYDIAATPPTDLISAMSEAAERDLVARQYVNGFAEVLDAAVPWIVDGCQRGWRLTEAIVQAQLRMMRDFPDSLISRKCGLETARESAARAGAVLATAGAKQEDFWLAVSDFDFWLRADGNRRNPGTTADFMAAGLFVALRDELIQPPFH